MPPIKKAFRLLLATLCLHAVLVGTHRGEFWPFSIYPMFSQAGRVWERAIVRHVPNDAPDSLIWKSFRFEALPGEPFPVERHGIPQNELSDYLSMAKTWDSDRRAGLRAFFTEYFATEPDAPRLAIMKAAGPHVDQIDGARLPIEVMPLFVITPDTLIENPLP